MPSPPPPPVPQKLREMLGGYPEHVQAIQDDLDEVVARPFKGTPLFEQAIWALEGRLETFYSEARAELQAAEASGDVAAIELAKAKKLLMGHARSKSTGGGMLDLDGLWNYFEANKEAFDEHAK